MKLLSDFLSASKSITLHTLDTISDALIFFKNNFVNLLIINTISIATWFATLVITQHLRIISFPVNILGYYLLLRIAVMQIDYINHTMKKGKKKLDLKGLYKRSKKFISNYILMGFAVGGIILIPIFIFLTGLMLVEIASTKYFMIVSGTLLFLFLYGQYSITPFLTVLYPNRTGFLKMSKVITMHRKTYVILLNTIPFIPNFLVRMLGVSLKVLNVDIVNHIINIFTVPLWFCTVLFMIRKLEKYPNRKLRSVTIHSSKIIANSQ